MEERRTFWIIIEQDPAQQDPSRQFVYLQKPNTKRVPYIWDTLEEAKEFFTRFESEYWATIERARQANPQDPSFQITRQTKPWKSFAAKVKCIPNSKYLNKNFLSKHVLEVKEFIYENKNEVMELVKQMEDAYSSTNQDGYQGFLY